MISGERDSISSITDYRIANSYKGTCKGNNFWGLATIPNYLKPLTINSDKLTFYFIPKDFYDCYTTHNSVYEGYHPFDYLISYHCDVNLQDVKNLINYKSFKKTTGDVKSGEICLTTSRVNASHQYQSRQAEINEHCGSGIDGESYGNTKNKEENCFTDSQSTKPGNSYHTSDPERYIESSNYIKRNTASTHSKTIIIIVVVAAVVIIPNPFLALLVSHLISRSDNTPSL